MQPNGNEKVRIVDRWGHTLFYFNCETGHIEIKALSRRGGGQSTKGELYSIGVDQLKAVASGNRTAEKPVFVFIAQQIELQKEQA